MAVLAYWYTNFFRQIWQNSPAYTGWKPSGGDSFKIMLVGPAYIPNQDTHSVKNDVAGEVSGQGYNAGGQALTAKTISASSGALVLAASSVTWSNCILTAVKAVIYDDTNSSSLSKQLVRWIDFGQAIKLNNQTLSIQFDAEGVVDIIILPPSDSAAPQLLSAVINTSTLIVTYNESLDTASTPATSSYIVRVNGVAQSTPGAVVVGSTTVTITTAVPITGGQSIALDYTAPALNPLQDAIGNDAASFQNLTVQNTTVTPLADNSTFVSQSVPASMVADSPYTVTVVMNNSGTTSWGPSYALRSTNPDSTNRWGAVTVPLTQIILPGASATITFPIQAPSLAGAYNFQWQMFNGTTNFGASSANQIITVDEPAPLTSLSLLLQAPNGGEAWLTGASQTIRWVTSGVANPSTVLIELSRDGGSTYATLFSGVSNTGAQAWTVSGAVTTTAKMRITSEVEPTATDTSSATFIISAPPISSAALTIISPNGGENFLAGSVQTLRWSSSNLNDTIKVELTRNAGSTFETLFPALTDDGSENWTVTQPTSTQTRLKISGVSNPAVTDTSNANFTISVQVSGNTRFVSLTGSDITGTGTQLNPWRTIRHALTLGGVRAGDTLYARGGSYGERIRSNLYTLPVGSSFSNAPIISGFGSEPVTVRNIGLTHAYVQYIIFQNLTVDGENTEVESVYASGGAHHCRFQDMRITRARAQGVLLPHTTEHHFEFIRCEVFGNGFGSPGGGTSQNHGLYIAGSDNLFDSCLVHDNNAYGYHGYNGYGGADRANRNVIRNSRFYRNGILLGPFAAYAILIGSGDDNLAYNNLIYDNRGGIDINFFTPLRNAAYFNTIFRNGTTGGLKVGTSATNSVVRNNIIYQNTDANYTHNGSGTLEDHNLRLGENPLFLNSTNFDFHIQAPTIAGVAVSGITTDFAGTTRGNPPNIGAYEF